MKETSEARRVTLYAFMAEAPGLIAAQRVVILSSQEDLEELVRSRANEPNAEVVIIPPEKWNPLRLKSVAQSELAAKFPQILACVQRTLRRLGLPAASLKNLSEDAFALPNPVTGTVLFVFRIQKPAPQSIVVLSRVSTPLHRPRGAMFIALLGILLVAMGLWTAYGLATDYYEDRATLFGAQLVCPLPLVTIGALLLVAGIHLRRTIQGKLTMSRRWPFLVPPALGLMGAIALIAMIVSVSSTPPESGTPLARSTKTSWEEQEAGGLLVTPSVTISLARSPTSLALAIPSPTYTTTPAPPIYTPTASSIEFKHAETFGPWAIRVVNISQTDQIPVIPQGNFKVAEGFILYLVELELENTANTTKTLIVDPQKIEVIDSEGTVYTSIGGTSIGRAFIVHAYYIGGSISMKTDSDPTVTFTATAIDEKTKEWTIELAGRGTAKLTMAFTIPKYAQVKELRWPGLKPFALAPVPTSTCTSASKLSATPSSTYTPTQGPGDERPSTYTVQRGDTLAGIAKRFGISLEALIAYNEIKDPNKLRVGEELRLPPSGYVSPVPSSTLRRPENGTFFKGPGPASCLGDLEIHNGTSYDAVTVLTTLEKETVLSVYVRAHSQFIATGICDGSYRLFFVLGEDWDEAKGAFTRPKSYEVFEEMFDYTTTSTAATGWQVTLHEVIGGSAKTESVRPKEFPPLR